MLFFWNLRRMSGFGSESLKVYVLNRFGRGQSWLIEELLCFRILCWVYDIFLYSFRERVVVGFCGILKEVVFKLICKVFLLFLFSYLFEVQCLECMVGGWGRGGVCVVCVYVCVWLGSSMEMFRVFVEFCFVNWYQEGIYVKLYFIWFLNLDKLLIFCIRGVFFFYVLV